MSRHTTDRGARRTAALAATAASVAALCAPVAAAGPAPLGAGTAAVGPATGVTLSRDGRSASAQLNGTVQTGGRAATWVFEYGTDSYYGEFSESGVIRAGTPGPVHVTARVTDLAGGGRRYHFRLDLLIVDDDPSTAGYYPDQYPTSGDGVLTTPGFGLVGFGASESISARTGSADVRLACHSRFQRCRGSAGVAITAGHRRITCWTSGYSIAPERTLRRAVLVSRACLARLERLPHGRSAALLTVHPLSPGQPRRQGAIELRLRR